MKDVLNYRGFEVKYFWATNTLGARLKITDLRFGGTITLPIDYSVQPEYTAINFLKSREINIIGRIETPTTNILFTDDFDHKIKGK